MKYKTFCGEKDGHFAACYKKKISKYTG